MPPIDASPADAPVFVRVATTSLHGEIEVHDSGSGMSPEFVRTRLFKPFDSSKPGGFGIGAYEARELVKAMGGRLDVESREGLGSRFTIRLPLTRLSEPFHARVREAMRQAGIEIVSAEMFAFECLRTAGTPLFREISREFLR